MKRSALFALFLVAIALACGKQYPHDPVICTSDSDCAAGHQCLQNWARDEDAGTLPDGGTASCYSVNRSCQKPCSADSDCSYCGMFGVCAYNACDQTRTTTCGSFCGDSK